MQVSVTRISRTAGRAAACALVIAAFASPVTAQNLLTNAGFDTSLADWSNVGSTQGDDGTRSWVAFPEDVGGIAGSGSAQLALNAGSSSTAQIGLAQCVTVAAGQTYNYGARVKQPAGQSPAGVAAFIDVAFYSDAACATALNLGEEQGFALAIAYPPSDTAWVAIPGTVPTSASVVTAPAGAASAQFRVLIQQAGGTGAATVRFDNPFFGANLTPVQLQTYTVD